MGWNINDSTIDRGRQEFDLEDQYGVTSSPRVTLRSTAVEQAEGQTDTCQVKDCCVLRSLSSIVSRADGRKHQAGRTTLVYWVGR